MDDKEKAAIEAEARRDVAERGHHGPGLTRYLHATEQHAIKENRGGRRPGRRTTAG